MYRSMKQTGWRGAIVRFWEWYLIVATLKGPPVNSIWNSCRYFHTLVNGSATRVLTHSGRRGIVKWWIRTSAGRPAKRPTGGMNIYERREYEFITRTRKPNVTIPSTVTPRRPRKSMAAVLRSWPCGKARCRAECTRIIASPCEIGRSLFLVSWIFHVSFDIARKSFNVPCRIFLSCYRKIIPSADYVDFKYENYRIWIIECKILLIFVFTLCKILWKKSLLIFSSTESLNTRILHF